VLRSSQQLVVEVDQPLRHLDPSPETYTILTRNIYQIRAWQVTSSAVGYGACRPRTLVQPQLFMLAD
jgi:hypothetical protein